MLLCSIKYTHIYYRQNSGILNTESDICAERHIVNNSFFDIILLKYSKQNFDPVLCIIRR